MLRRLAGSLAFSAAGVLGTLLGVGVLGLWALPWWLWHGAAAVWHRARKGRRKARVPAVRLLPARPLWSAAELAALADEESLEQLLQRTPLLRREGKLR